MMAQVRPLPGTAGVPELKWEGSVPELFVPDGACRLPGKHLKAFGACWVSAGYLLVTDLGRDLIWFWQPGGLPKAFRKPAGGPTFLKLDPHGRLHVLENLCSSISRTEIDGGVVAIVDLEKLGNNADVADFAVDADENLYIAVRTETVAGFGSQKIGTIQRFRQFKKVEEVGSEIPSPIGIDWDEERSSLWAVNGPDGAVWQLRRETKEDVSYRWNARRLCDLWQDDEIDSGGIAVRKDGLIGVASMAGVFLISQEGETLGKLHLPEPPFRVCWGGPWTPHDLLVTAGCSVYLIPGRTG